MSQDNGNNTDKDLVLDAILNDQPLPVDNDNQNNSDNQDDNQHEGSNQIDPLDNTKNQDPGQSATNSTGWISEASKSIGIEIQSEDELKDLINKGRSYGDLESRSSALSQELERLKTSQEENPFANDHIKKVNELIKAGAPPEQIKLFTEIDSLDLKTLSPVEAKVLALRYEHGLTKEEAENMVNSSYKIGDDFDKSIIDSELIRLKIDSKKDFQFLEELKTKSATNPLEAKQAEYETKIQEYTKSVQPIAKSIQESLTLIKGVNLNGKQGQDAITIDLPISEESRSKISDLVVKFAVQNDIPLNEQGIQELKGFAENVAIIENWRSMAVDIASKTEERIRAEFHNPSNINRGNDNPVDSKVTQEKQIEDWVLNHS